MQSVENVVSTVGPIAAAAAALAPSVAKAGKAFTDSSGAQWRAVIAALASMVVLAYLVVRSCAPGLAPIGYTTPVEALPEVLRSAARCESLPSLDGAGGKCVIGAGDPILAGGLGGGKDLTVTIGLLSADRLSEEVRRWRGAGGSVVSDGAVFAAIGPASSVWYADTRSGLRVETGSLAGAAAARAFLVRSGLLR
ncbi:hypothetical protein ACFROC_17480 [Nocardia tengchongensis]|uniref:hypothetical protein n=1 Tax=Nocardia tengchongensis TaxID=2055889 RepID=UPI0036B52272